MFLFMWKPYVPDIALFELLVLEWIDSRLNFRILDEIQWQTEKK